MHVYISQGNITIITKVISLLRTITVMKMYNRE